MKRAAARTQAPAAPPPPPAAARRPGPPAWLCRIAGIALVVIGGAIVCASWRQLMAERMLWKARTRAEREVDSRMREIELQRAHQFDSTHPIVVSDRARFMIRAQKIYFQNNQINLMDAKKLEEALALLDGIDATYHFQPGLLRTRGEAAMMLAELHRRQGDEAEARRWIQKGFEDLYEASRKLPRPKVRGDEFNPGAVIAAQLVGREDAAVDFLMRMNRFGERRLLTERGILRNATQAWFAVGLLPHQMREIHAALMREPDDPILIGALRLSSETLGQRTAAIKILEDLERNGKLRPASAALLQQLRNAAQAPPIPAKDAEAHDQEATPADGR